MSDADIEATKAPLIEHLMELRERLIRALLAFLVMFLVSFTSPRIFIIFWSCPISMSRGRRRG